MGIETKIEWCDAKSQVDRFMAFGANWRNVQPMLSLVSRKVVVLRGFAAAARATQRSYWGQVTSEHRRFNSTPRIDLWRTLGQPCWDVLILYTSANQASGIDLTRSCGVATEVIKRLPLLAFRAAFLSAVQQSLVLFQVQSSPLSCCFLHSQYASHTIELYLGRYSK